MTEGNKMARTKTGSKSGIEAFKVLMQWRSESISEVITKHEAWIITGGIAGRHLDANTVRLIEVAVDYTVKGGSLKDYIAVRAEA